MFNLKRPNQTNLYIDLAIFAGFLLATVPALTGLAIHEWFGLAFGAALLIHLLIHWKWVVAVTRRFFDKLLHGSRWNYLLNLALFVAFDMIIFSGLMISRSVLPLFGLEESHSALWRFLHDQATNAALLLVGLHVALHWKWALNNLKRYIGEPVRRIFHPAPAARPGYVPVQHNDRGAVR